MVLFLPLSLCCKNHLQDVPSTYRRERTFNSTIYSVNTTFYFKSSTCSYYEPKYFFRGMNPTTRTVFKIMSFSISTMLQDNQCTKSFMHQRRFLILTQRQGTFENLRLSAVYNFSLSFPTISTVDSKVLLHDDIKS